MKSKLMQGETVIKEGDANMQQGLQSVGGKLYLTNHRLVFEKHKLNIGSEGLSMHLARVRKIRPTWTKLLNLIPVTPNAIAVATNDGKEHQFIVFGRQKWLDAIAEQRA